MTDLPALLGRLRAATGPDRSLDADICVALGYVPDLKEPCIGLRWGFNDPEWGDDQDLLYEIVEDGATVPCVSSVPALTGSIDAAVDLVERMLPGAHWRLLFHGIDEEMGDVCDFSARVLPCKLFHQGATAPLAILIATLQALMAREGQ